MKTARQLNQSNVSDSDCFQDQVSMFTQRSRLRPEPCCLEPGRVTSVGTEGGDGHGLHFLSFKARGYSLQATK